MVDGKITVSGKAVVKERIEVEEQFDKISKDIKKVEEQGYNPDAILVDPEKTMEPKRVLVLLSGGMDSATCMAKALHDGYKVFPLMFHYGQQHNVEVANAHLLVRHFEEKYLDRVSKIFDFEINLRQIGGSALTADIPMPEGEQEGIPASYVPGRNVILISIALAYAEVNNCSEVWYGANIIDYSGYPDCRPEFVDAMEHVAKLGYKSGVEGKPIDIVTPIIRKSKKEIIELGTKLNVPFGLTWSCYNPQTKDKYTGRGVGRVSVSLSGKIVACGVCPACVLRLLGFFEAGWPDPIEYDFDGDRKHCPQCRRTNLEVHVVGENDERGAMCPDCGWST